MIQRIYIDTSIVGGFFDEEFKEATIKLFERLEKREIIFVVSDLLDLELINAPLRVREHLLQYPNDRFERVDLTEEAVAPCRCVHKRKSGWKNKLGRLPSYCFGNDK